MENQKEVLGARGLGPGDEGLPAADACQHHLLNLSCRPRKPTNLEENFLFLPNDAGMLLKTKDDCGRPCTEAGMYMKTKGISAESWNVGENTGS